ncbi:MAG: zinc-ribbon domain-containing protein [Ruminiclostridium sp.]
MAFCTKCGTQMPDNSFACPNCGAPTGAAAAPVMQPVAVDPYDHTAEFTAKDISDNKVVAMLCYLLGTIGLIIACLLSTDSPYVKFHVKSCLKITVVEALLWFTLIVPFLGWLFFGVCSLICSVIRIICFFQICSGKAKEPAIIRGLPFLK